MKDSLHSSTQSKERRSMKHYHICIDPKCGWNKLNERITEAYENPNA